MKQYNLGGLGSNVELGKSGPSIVGSDSSQVTLNNASGNLTLATVAEGTDADHAVQKQQLDSQLSQKLRFLTTTVNHNGGNVDLGTTPANATIHSVTVERVAAWTGYNSTTEISVGDAGDIDRLFSDFDPDGGQLIEESNYQYSSATQLNAYVTQGGASAGTATITIKYSAAGDIE